MSFHEELLQILPHPVAQILEGHRLAAEFRHESQLRDDHERHCQWYADTAERHRQEFEQLRRDFNFLSWLRARRG